VAWEFRQLFYPHRRVALQSLRLQALKILKSGRVKAEELLQAMREAKARRLRHTPKTLVFFLAWVVRLRAWKDRMLREADERERRWKEEQYERLISAPRQGGKNGTGEEMTSLGRVLPRVAPVASG
jgi:hypothetical protein